MNWADIKYEIADRLFAKELDEAYSQGIRIGAEYATKKIGIQLATDKRLKQLTPAKAAGYNMAIERFQDCKPEISEQTGAML